MIIPGAPMDERKDGDWFEVSAQPDKTRRQEGEIEVIFKLLLNHHHNVGQHPWVHIVGQLFMTAVLDTTETN